MVWMELGIPLEAGGGCSPPSLQVMLQQSRGPSPGPPPCLGFTLWRFQGFPGMFGKGSRLAGHKGARGPQPKPPPPGQS